MSGDEREGGTRTPDSKGSHAVGGLPKVVLASPEWYELAVKILAEVAQECGEDGFQLSVCEVFINPPRELADEDGRMSWCFYIDGKHTRCERGNSKDVDVYMEGSWDPADARRILTPEYLEEQAENPTSEDPNLLIEGDLERLPAWMIEFHNRVALHTA